ncbi:MAG: hypothetical protein WD010_08980 [Nitriliruptor sp.]|uniref:hypothetical protein n=1 Tax=Nitriliruptor sp. TaxID=2448056 RepID=UPI0034A01A1A
MSTVRVELVALALGLGIAALAVATTVATRHETAVRGGRVRGLAPLVPWLGTLVVVLLLIRGATAGALVVGVVTVIHAGVTRWRAVTAARRHP